MDPIEQLKKELQNSLTDLKKMYLQNDENAGNLIEEGFRLELDWIDKIITLSVSIISVTITILLAMRDSSEYLSCAFFWMWLSLALSAGFCLLARFSYANLKFAQGKKARLFQKNVHSTYYKIAEDNSHVEIEVDFLEPSRVDIIDPANTNTKIWSNLSNYSSKVGLIFFVIGIILFVFIGKGLIR